MEHETLEFFSFACLIKSNVQQFCSIEQSLFSLLFVQPTQLTYVVIFAAV